MSVECLTKVTAALKRIVEEVQRLSESDRRELQTLLPEICSTPLPMNESAFEHALAAQGLLTLPTPAAPASGEACPLIETRGRPLSEILLEERR